MIELTHAEHTFFQFTSLARVSGLRHIITTRKGGNSENKFASFNLSYTVGDEDENVDKNFSDLAGFMGISRDIIVVPKQCHSANVKIVNHATDQIQLANTDALITGEHGICIGVLTADCVPILLYDHQKCIIAAVHAGWRGTAGNITGRTIHTMMEKFNSSPKNILACIGPCISAEIYEVGSEVSDIFRQVFGRNELIIQCNSKTGKDHINLVEANLQILLRNGVTRKNVETSDMCTYKNQNLFFSARRNGINTGRFASCIMLA